MSTTEDVATLTPGPLMQLATGFWAFKTLAAAHELDLFTRLAFGRPEVTPEELAKELGIQERPAQVLLTACASLGLLERGDRGYRNTPLSERFLVRGTPYYFGGLVTMFDRRLYPGWGKLIQAVRTNRPTTWDPDRQRSLFEGEDPAVLQTFWEAMHSISSFTARALGNAVDLGSARRLLDVGGGSGAFAVELCRQYRSLCATVFDLPFVVDIAADKIADAGLRDRIGTHSGDFFVDPLPAGHDVHLYSMIMHDWDEQRDRLLLRKSFEALPSGGLVIISELLVDDDKAGPPAAALMSLNMLVETEGRNYTASEYSAWLQDAGFVEPRTVRFDAPGANGGLVARKP
ncbi:MAG TPA: methyltransferase [Actinomycetes bacterium]|jgi:predicted O-methyltransferase YrrM|nr:methyltransferase [Actinomycetes bacterium]